MTAHGEPRRRAPGMSADRRRAMIVHTALPLLAAHGPRLTTAQVARAAGIGEATVFRAFADKQALLDACANQVLHPGPLLEQLAAVNRRQPLAERLTDAATAVRAHLDRVATVLGALYATGRPGPPSAGDRPRDAAPVPAQQGHDRAPTGRADAAQGVRAAIVALLAPDADRFRLPVERVAELFLALLPPRGPLGVEPPSPAELVQVFLHGVLTPQPVR
ncbi:TetR/AcrR family transcriptional regulator [Micromonospora coxensis]|uniref:Transcriptional regulator, TetR family n=1 Tax=Micromonospora coxensis TaxID=356852 RepID=A0A1C5GP62_9ACTN|nr:TetR/AcrR family transcriptional regulator [Micromonospora coxensis]SCG35562.1 transcriptional regulator, TetR family [Micromonospora coxensis]